MGQTCRIGALPAPSLTPSWHGVEKSIKHYRTSKSVGIKASIDGRVTFFAYAAIACRLRKLAEGRQGAAACVPMAYKEGMLSLRLSGAQKVANGLTTIHGVLRGTPDMQG